MVSTDAVWAGVYGTSGIALCLGADTRLGTGAARAIQIQSAAATNSRSTPSEDGEIVYLLKEAMSQGNKGRG